MSTTVMHPTPAYTPTALPATMRANVFLGPDRIEVREVPRPRASAGVGVEHIGAGGDFKPRGCALSPSAPDLRRVPSGAW